ncbi:MAG: DUF3472 domain-containing protein [Kiritimatiellae bacterium]|nr:DUF3472 domain-containing protein [Kiritimatiellia bacterium]
MRKAAIVALLAAMSGCASQAMTTNRARSVHLQYAPVAERAVALRGSVTVTQTQTNTYFAIINCDRAYCGIQDLGARGRIFIFSVWEPDNGFDLNARQDQVAEDVRAKILYVGTDTKASRFGGEGTGAKTITEIGWKEGETVTAMIEAEPDGADRTAFTCIIRQGENGPVRKIATISTIGRMTSIGSPFASFVEDFWRRPPSSSLVRRAVFSGFASRSEGSAEWIPVTRAKFSADDLQVMTIDAGKVGPGAYFLQTGGDTKNEHAPLWSIIE